MEGGGRERRGGRDRRGGWKEESRRGGEDGKRSE